MVQTKEYKQQYYREVMKDKIISRKSYCDICNKSLTGWNVDKHRYSLQHKKNCMSEEELTLYYEEKKKKQEEKRLARQIERLKELMDKKNEFKN